MERYITQLISDIRQATWNLKPPHEIWEDVDPDNEVELEDISYVEEYVYGKPEKISAITSIATELLPYPEKLNEDQAGLLASELEKLLNFFHFYLDFPEDYPLHFRYPFIREIWDDEYVPLSFGESHIEFCDYDETICPFPGYCNTCKEVDEQMKHDEEIVKRNRSNDPDQDDELPF
jgi:hypothetical protein